MWKPLEEATRTAAAVLCQTYKHIVAITRDVSISNTFADGNNNSSQHQIYLQVFGFNIWS